MKTNNLFSKFATVLAIAATGVVVSCQENETPLAQEASYVVEESVTDVYFEDSDDMAAVAMQSKSETAGNGRISAYAVTTSNDDRFTCAEVTIDVISAETPEGIIAIDFGNGCTDPRGNVRTGKIKLHFIGRRFMPESTITMTFENYTINGIALEGERTLTNISESTEEAPKFQISLVNGKATWPDGTDATREHCFVREWIRAENPINDEWHISQCADAEVAASGTNRRGVSYEMEILETLVYKRGCPLAVEGVKQFTNLDNGSVVTIDYGDGTCDKVVTITVDGNSREVRVGSR
jgi:hypothetical protein